MPQHPSLLFLHHPLPARLRSKALHFDGKLYIDSARAHTQNHNGFRNTGIVQIQIVSYQMQN